MTKLFSIDEKKTYEKNSWKKNLVSKQSKQFFFFTIEGLGGIWGTSLCTARSMFQKRPTKGEMTLIANLQFSLAVLYSW